MLVDWERVKTIADPDNPDDKEWLLEMIQSLEEDINQKVEELSGLYINGDLAKLQASLHQVKGVSANFGLIELQQLSFQAETEVKAKNLSGSEVFLNKIPILWEETLQELRRKFPKE
ncbi:MAG: Hpt domain-containing protein [Leptospiraceae bacterium]|nr:Hpt domain-containing protein [Leptospiraceae bacterium]